MRSASKQSDMERSRAERREAYVPRSSSVAGSGRSESGALVVDLALTTLPSQNRNST